MGTKIKETKNYLYSIQTIQMKERRLDVQCFAEKESIRKKALVAAALAWVLSLWSPSEWLAQNTSTVQGGANVTEVTKLWTEVEDEKTITLETAMQGLEWHEKSKLDIAVHWLIQVWTSIVPDFAEICSDKASLLICLDASNPQTWLWLTIARLDDFHEDPEYPASKATVINGHRNKTFWEEWRASISIEWKYTFIDNLPWANGFAPDIVGSYTTKNWWTFEWMYSHAFKEWKDRDAIRLWVTKKINDALSLTAQWWYKSDYDKVFFGRIIANVNFWEWFWAQLSCVAKDWELIPTVWVLYKF